MSKRTANLAEEPFDQDRASLVRYLDDLRLRCRAARLRRPTAQEMAALTEEVREAHLRVIAFARSRGGVTFARMMCPDEPVGENVVSFRRRVR
jgi:hypothetical protein